MQPDEGRGWLCVIVDIQVINPFLSVTKTVLLVKKMTKKDLDCENKSN